MIRWRILGLTISGAALLLMTGTALADYSEGNFVNNGMFIDSAAMGATSLSEFQSGSGQAISNIQSFLNSEGSGIATMSFGGASECDDSSKPLPNGATSASAAYLIAYASWCYGINPRTIMATMQKEQSLITDPAPSASQYNYAMGYGCPDTAGCSTTYLGFFQQVFNASWQMRMMYERTNGNSSTWTSPAGYVWGASTISYPCTSGSTTYYTTNNAGGAYGLYPGNTIKWLYNGSVYTTSVIANAASAALYCYTPHAYQSGIYTGSYNFVGSWEAWWGETTPSYASRYVSESVGTVGLLPGQTASVSITYLNAGNMPWYDDTTAASNNALPVHLATSHQINRHSGFGTSWGGDDNRAANTFSAVIQTNGTPYATNPHVVQPGESATFTFILTGNAAVSPGSYAEFFQPIVEGGSVMNDPWTFIQVNEIQPVWSSSYAGESPVPAMQQGQSESVWLRYHNTGNMTWYDDTTARSHNALPVHLATTHDINRHSVLGMTWGGDRNRTGGVFGAVYESDGTTLAADQHSVQPGQIVQFNFDLTAQLGYVNPGTYREFFQPIVEGGSVMNDPWTFLDVTVTAATFSSQYYSQSSYPTLAPGQSGSVYLEYKNTGNAPWYDVTDTPVGDRPVVLATSHAINRASVFADMANGGWCANGDHNRAACSFTAVYLSDGATLSSNQHVVQPGEIAKFAFNLAAPSSAIAGSYPEFFQPIVEGYTIMNDPWTFLTVTVP